MISQVLASFTIVQTGTFNINSGALAQCIFDAQPASQDCAFNTFLCLYSERVFKFGSVNKKTSPHLQPSHPQGPHFGIYFSFLHEITQSHHFQEITLIFTSSINIF
jgi:hypothetical protein